MTPSMLAALDWLVAMTVWTALLVAAARAADRLLAPRVCARARMLLYAAPFVRLLLPARWEGGYALADVARAMPRLTPIEAGTFSFAPAPAPPTSPASAVDAVALLVVIAYVGSAVALLVLRLRAHRRATRGLVAARPDVAELAPGVPVFESADAGPAVVGVLRPRILLPSRLVGTLDRDALAWIVRHEATHIAARDPLLLAAVQLVVIALWPVAPLWFALHRVRSLIELACDERTLARAAESEKRGFMRVLFEMSESAPRRVRPVGTLGFGDGLAERLRALARGGRRWPRMAQAAVVGGLAAALVACASAGAARDPDVDCVLVRVVAVDWQPPPEGGGPQTPGGGEPDGPTTGGPDAGGPSTPAGGGGGPSSGGGRGGSVATGHRMIETKFLSGGRGLCARAEHAIRCEQSAIVADRIDVDPAARVLVAPTLVAADGEESTISLANGRRELVGRFKTTPAGPGTVDFEFTFEQRDGDQCVREVRRMTIRLRDGESVLVPMQAR